MPICDLHVTQLQLQFVCALPPGHLPLDQDCVARCPSVRPAGPTIGQRPPLSLYVGS